MCALLIASADCEAWLVALDHESAPEGVALCSGHADRIRVPVGWTLHDTRPAAAPRRQRRKRKPTPPEPAPIAEPEPVIEPVAAAAPEPAPIAEPDTALPSSHSPADTPMHADDVAAAIPDDDPRHLQVVPPGAPKEAAAVFDESGQGALWDSPADDPDHDELEASDRTPLLKRAFRVVRED